ncbi:helix-turn-helix domain-containing protein [Inquilinus sp.]|jgi:putative transcriptional regulator|uniref:helix-turn-helix domain-containing protein n=1 Tax=Inquilinus sp. TaxID=1932117 RepID=UPI003782E5D3
MAIVKFTLDPDNPPELTAEQKALLDALTDEEIEANAASDLDNPPMTDEELTRAVEARRVRMVRTKTGLSQPAFSRRYRIPLPTLRHWEAGRRKPDRASWAYLQVIEAMPAAVAEVLDP